MTNPLRKIIHIDMDAYYASIEIKDNPALRGKPLVVGGPPNSRSVVSTASYEARQFGIRSAMACSIAARLCPHAIFLPPRFDRYKEISYHIRDIFHRYTDLVEPMSLDEAYLDVSDKELYAIDIAKAIKKDIFDELQLTCSAGIGPNKLIAKIASDYRKPNGITVVRPHQVQDFMANLSVRKINGVGPATETRLKAHNILICKDIWPYPLEQFMEIFGNWGEWLWHAAQGVDERPVKTTWNRKSYGREDTFDQDITSPEALFEKLAYLASRVASSLQHYQKQGRTVTLKVKYSNFDTITRRNTISDYTDNAETIFNIAHALLSEKTDLGERPVRLLGISVSNLLEEEEA
jgi:DNA polymerase-4